ALGYRSDCDAFGVVVVIAGGKLHASIGIVTAIDRKRHWRSCAVGVWLQGGINGGKWVSNGTAGGKVVTGCANVDICRFGCGTSEDGEIRTGIRWSALREVHRAIT